jgi:hypothetical protein
MQAPTASPEMQMKGVHIYMGGIGLQQFFIGIFLLLAARFHSEMQRLEKLGQTKMGWKGLICSLYTSLGFITVRVPSPLSKPKPKFNSKHKPQN